MKKYDHKRVEKKWSDRWEKEGIYKTPKNVSESNKYYVLPQLPYPSGLGLHVGHAEVYTSCDIYARFKRMTGNKVLQVIGWDSFGLPAENYAIKNNIHPKKITNEAIDNFRYQIKRMGISVDWDREVGSHNPDYYKWTQWFFLLMYERGLAYRKKQQVNWCDSCKTVLANDQVVEGRCERCDTKVEQRMMEQWCLKITDYADRLYKDLDKVDWPRESIKRQRDWIGKSEGALLNFRIEDTDDILEVFTTRPDTLFGTTFMVVAPEHKIFTKIRKYIKNIDEVDGYIKEAKNKTELERQQQEKEKTGVKLEGIYCINPVNKKKVSVYVADYVLMSYGTGAIMGVPAHDERDYEFAKKHKLDVIPVICPNKVEDITAKKRLQKDGENIATGHALSYFANKGSIKSAFKEFRIKVKKGLIIYTGDGLIINSGEWNGWRYPDDLNKVIEWLEKRKIGTKKTMFKLRDWSVSRQRFWGAPIPMVYDSKNKLHPVDKNDLPVMLPDDVDFMPTGRSPLTYSKEFQKGVERKYGKGWRREVDTLDTFMCSSWYYYRYLDPHNNEEFASRKALKTWMPVDFYIGGPEHVTGHLLYSRFFTKVLYDAGYIDFDEPFIVHRHQGLILGEDNRKMSKRWGNIINPTDVMDRHGADTLRLYEMFMGPLSEAKAWNLKGEKGIYRFVNRLWGIQDKVANGYKSTKQEIYINKLIKKVSEDIENLSFNTAIAKFMEFTNSIKRFKKVNRTVWERFLLVLAPFAPFIAEEFWEILGNKFSVHQHTWPSYDKKLIDEDEVTIAVQINGKLRDTIRIQKDATKQEVIRKAKESKKVEKYLKKVEKRVVYVENKILNFVL